MGMCRYCLRKNGFTICNGDCLNCGRSWEVDKPESENRMTNKEAAVKLSAHLHQCGMLMPIEWVEKNGEGSELAQAFKLALDALNREEVRHE